MFDMNLVATIVKIRLFCVEEENPICGDNIYY